jgi:hypothetical protein
MIRKFTIARDSAQLIGLNFQAAPVGPLLAPLKQRHSENGSSYDDGIPWMKVPNQSGNAGLQSHGIQCCIDEREVRLE